MSAANQPQFSYNPRPIFMGYHTRTQRYACIIAHRRAGKSFALLNDIIVRGLHQRPDNLKQQFALMAPTQSQARAISWGYLKDQTACFKNCPGYKVLEQHLTVTLPNPTNANLPGSTIMLVGAENAERLRGLFLDGIVIDEAADVPEHIVTSIIRPALADRQGWLTVSGTVKSVDDYLWRSYLLAQKAPRLWYSTVLRASETGIIPQHELDDLRLSMTEESYAVEFECDVNAAVTGRILLPYHDQTKVTKVPYDPAGSPLVTAWDLGIADAMAVWVLQMCGKEPHLINHHEASGKSLADFVQWLRKLPYANALGAHLVPPDSKVRELGSGKSRVEVMRELGMRNIKVVTKLSKADQIEAGRLLLPKCWFNEDTTEDGRKALRNYSYAFDPIRKVFSQSPLHNSHSNSSDAFLYLAVGMKKANIVLDNLPKGFESDMTLDTMLDDEEVIAPQYEVDYEF